MILRDLSSTMWKDCASFIAVLSQVLQKITGHNNLYNQDMKERDTQGQF